MCLLLPGADLNSRHRNIVCINWSYSLCDKQFIEKQDWIIFEIASKTSY